MSILLAEARRAPTDAFAILGGLLTAEGFFSLYGFEFRADQLAAIARTVSRLFYTVWNNLLGPLNIDVGPTAASLLSLFTIGAGMALRGKFRGYAAIPSLRDAELVGYMLPVGFAVAVLFGRLNIGFGPSLTAQGAQFAVGMALGTVIAFFPRVLFGALMAGVLLFGADALLSPV